MVITHESEIVVVNNKPIENVEKLVECQAILDFDMYKVYNVVILKVHLLIAAECILGGHTTAAINGAHIWVHLVS